MTAGNAATATFVLLPGETVLPLRVMLDTRSVEIFAAGGRGKHVNIDTDLLSVCLSAPFLLLFISYFRKGDGLFGTHAM